MSRQGTGPLFDMAGSSVPTQSVHLVAVVRRMQVLVAVSQQNNKIVVVC